ncbi:peptidylprolyl isomerase [Rubrobacter indicoceani]|uniref:peptidylprolyl isomerase n=1 Tax=Rubrobacter indicoceani TaxID=2051957 RepID=UPI0013C4565A|nr:peptidylprolyl isomerase [Rubrobacter indicoceani]
MVLGNTFLRRVALSCGLAVVVLGAGACGAADTTANQPSGAERVATFDGGEVTQGELQEAIDLFAQQSGTGEVEPGSPQYDLAAQQVLPSLVQQEIAVAYAEENNITVSDGDVESEIETIKTQLSEQASASGQELSGDEALNQALEQAGLTEDDLRDDIRSSLPVQKVQERITSDVEPTDEEVRTYYDENADTAYTTPPQRCARHILYGPDQREQAEEAFQRLEDEDADFQEIAREDSQDPGSAEQGGDLGCIGRGETVPNFEEALFNAEEGETVGPVETQFGYHIIRLYEIREEQTQPFDEVEGEIRDQLTAEQQGVAFTEWLAGQEEERNVEYLPAYDPNAAAEETTAAQE